MPSFEIARHAVNAVATDPNDPTAAPPSRLLALTSSGNRDVATALFMDRPGVGLGQVTGSDTDGWVVNVNQPLTEFADWYAVAQDQQTRTFFFMFDTSTMQLKVVVVRAGEFPQKSVDSLPEELRSAVVGVAGAP